MIVLTPYPSVFFVTDVKLRPATGTPNYVQGAKGYGQRTGAEAAAGFSDIVIGGAILPSLLPPLGKIHRQQGKPETSEK
jgi:hypothetical protein